MSRHGGRGGRRDTAGWGGGDRAARGDHRRGAGDGREDGPGDRPGGIRGGDLPPWEQPGGDDPRGAGRGRAGFGEPSYEDSRYEESRRRDAGYRDAGYDPEGHGGTADTGDVGSGWAGYDGGAGHDGAGHDGAGYDEVGYGEVGYGEEGYGGEGYGGEGYEGEGYEGEGYEGEGYEGEGYEEAGYGDDSGYGGGAGYSGRAGDSGQDAGYSGQDAGYRSGPYPAYRAAGGAGPGTGYQAVGGEPYAGHRGAYGDHGSETRGRRAAPGDQGHARSGRRHSGLDDRRGLRDEEYREEFLPGLAGAAGPRSRRGAADRRGREPAAKATSTRRRGMRRVAAWLAIGVVLVLVIGAGGAFYYVYRTYLHPADYSGPGSGSVVVHIETGDTATTVGQILFRDGVVASARAFHNAAMANPKGNSLQPGYYRLRKHMKASLALAMLLNPSSRVVYKILIKEGLRLSQIVAVLGAQTHDPAGYLRAVKQTSALGLPSYAHGKPEGYLFPATYQVAPGTPPIKVLQEMTRRFAQEAASVKLSRWAAHDQMTENQVIILASLVQAEGRRPSDFPKIARVIYNRLNLNMPLELDSTVMYALNTSGIAATGKQLNAAKKSPYDTYTHLGLPPGPIDSPGDAAIRAALHPAHGGWLYFVTVNPKTGLTKFTSSYTQFSQWEAQFRAALAKGGG